MLDNIVCNLNVRLDRTDNSTPILDSLRICSMRSVSSFAIPGQLTSSVDLWMSLQLVGFTVVVSRHLRGRFARSSATMEGPLLRPDQPVVTVNRRPWHQLDVEKYKSHQTNGVGLKYFSDHQHHHAWPTHYLFLIFILCSDSFYFLFIFKFIKLTYNSTILNTISLNVSPCITLITRQN